jgi:complement component 1 Q subcomponent-binding protein, mitochondrial
MNENQDQPELEMRSEPGFEVELVRGNQTLGFTCSFVHPEQQNPDDEYRKQFSPNQLK